MISALVNNDIPVDPTLDIYEIITKESQTPISLVKSITAYKNAV
jgi:hypothetical protein